MTEPDTKSRSYSIFPGCLIPSKYPFIEKASRKVFETLGIEIHEIEGASCCPNQMAIQATDKKLWYTIAARNLCLAEKNGCDIVSLCNGCYDTLKSVNTKLKIDEKFRAEINGILKSFDLEFEGKIEVKHVVQVIHDDIGVNAIEKKVVRPLDKFRVAPYVGCHVKRPMDHMGFDDPEDPYYLKDILKVLGTKIVSYSEEDSCCGGGLAIGRKDDVMPAARRVLRSAAENGADAFVVNCPYCFAQYFRNIPEINDNYPEKMDLPVFYFTQLIALSFGITPEELGMELHYSESGGSESKLINKLLAEDIENLVYNDEVTRKQLEICSGCQACMDDCSTAMTTSEYHPEEILELVLDGKIDEALARKDIWYCMNCHECTQHCPQNFGMVKLIIRLKNLAAATGVSPEVIGHRLSQLKESGYSFERNDELRAALGLEGVSGPDVTELRKLIKEVLRGN